MTRYIIGAVIALVLDYCVVVAALYVGLPLWLSRAFGIIVGVTTTYFFNRRFTFAAKFERASLREWAHYLSMQAVGTALNFLVSMAALYLGNKTVLHVAAAVCAGAIVGFSYNFFAAKKVLQKPAKE
jgi:putative flippase GtrA